MMVLLYMRTLKRLVYLSTIMPFMPLKDPLRTLYDVPILNSSFMRAGFDFLDAKLLNFWRYFLRISSESKLAVILGATYMRTSHYLALAIQFLPCSILSCASKNRKSPRIDLTFSFYPFFSPSSTVTMQSLTILLLSFEAAYFCKLVTFWQCSLLAFLILL